MSDGFPRTNATALDKSVLNRAISISMMLALEVDDDELIKRLLLRG
ncbi:MAG: hypothetical protein IPP29_25320 [Bacteroidetes bacterium]|nr:hypothetical protein [Bacteroidota bacterium]